MLSSKQEHSPEQSGDNNQQPQALVTTDNGNMPNLPEQPGDGNQQPQALVTTNSGNMPNLLPAVQVGGTMALYYFGPPYVAAATRTLFPLFYSLIFGSPTGMIPYCVTYIPAREQAVLFAAKHSHEIIVASIAGFYTVDHAARSVANSISETEYYKLVSSAVSSTVGSISSQLSSQTSRVTTYMWSLLGYKKNETNDNVNNEIEPEAREAAETKSPSAKQS